MNIVISKNDWIKIGEKMGWMEKNAIRWTSNVAYPPGYQLGESPEIDWSNERPRGYRFESELNQMRDTAIEFNDFYKEFTPIYNRYMSGKTLDDAFELTEEEKTLDSINNEWNFLNKSLFDAIKNLIVAITGKEYHRGNTSGKREPYRHIVRLISKLADARWGEEIERKLNEEEKSKKSYARLKEQLIKISSFLVKVNPLLSSMKTKQIKGKKGI